MLDIQDHDTVRELTLNRPPVNAINPALSEALLTAVKEAPDAGARAIVLSGQPGMFCAGLDVVELFALDRNDFHQFWSQFFELFRALSTSPIPIVAAITGHAPAGGAVLSILCDQRVMAQDTDKRKFKFGFNEVAVGLRVPRMIQDAVRFAAGAQTASRMCDTALMVGPDEALRLGVVDDTQPAEQVRPRALELAQVYASMPPQVAVLTRKHSRALLQQAADTHLTPAQVDEFVDIWFGEECRAVMGALVSKLGG